VVVEIFERLSQMKLFISFMQNCN